MSHVIVPHLAWPLRLGPHGAAAVVEQDTPEEVAQAVALLLSTQQGERLEVPDYGLPDQVFTTEPSQRAIIETLSKWEPRAIAMIVEEPDRLDAMVRQVEVRVGVRSQ